MNAVNLPKDGLKIKGSISRVLQKGAENLLGRAGKKMASDKIT